MKKIAIWGFGVTGQASLRYFLSASKYNNYHFDVFDPKSKDDFDIIDFKEKAVHFHFETNDIPNVMEYEILLVSPGISPKHPTIKQAYSSGGKVINDVALFIEEWKNIGETIGVTGSNGKSTTVNLIHGSLKALGMESILVGNIGKSPLDYLSKYSFGDSRKPIAVMELSSFQLETFQGEHFTDIAVITNITPNHLDRHNDDIQEYADAKMNIFNEEKSILVTVSDDEGIQKHILPFAKNVEKELISLKDNDVENKVLEEFLNPDTRNLKGEHNLYNIAVTLKVLERVGIELPNKSVSDFIKNYSGLEHRIEFVREIDGVKYINDSKSTSPDATRVALETFGDHKNIVLIAGGKDKNVSFSSWNDPLNQYVKKLIILDHDINQKMVDLAQKNDIEHVVVEDLQRAITAARDITESGDTVLLSPGASSFGRFIDFEDRGRIFKEIINAT